MKTLTSVEAQNHFGELLDTAQREPVTITRRGRPVAVVLSPQDAADVLAERQRRADAVAEFKALFAEMDAHLTDAGRALTNEDVVRLVHELR